MTPFQPRDRVHLKGHPHTSHTTGTVRSVDDQGVHVLWDDGEVVTAQRPLYLEPAGEPMSQEPLDLTALRDIAKAATDGPWEAYDANEGMDPAYSPMWCVANEEFHNPTTGDDEDWMGVEIHVGDKADSDHIAAFDPPTVLALLDRVEAAEAAVARVRDCLTLDSFDSKHPNYTFDVTAVDVDDVKHALDGGA